MSTSRTVGIFSFPCLAWVGHGTLCTLLQSSLWAPLVEPAASLGSGSTDGWVPARRSLELVTQFGHSAVLSWGAGLERSGRDAPWFNGGGGLSPVAFLFFRPHAGTPPSSSTAYRLSNFLA